MDRMVFIIGCGRSGTHWLGEVVTSFPGFSGTVVDMLGIPREVGTDLQKLRRACETVAYDPTQGGPKFPEIADLYERLRARHRPHYVDKTHGFIWGAEILAEMFPEAIFLGIERSVEPVVASLINRNGSMHARRAGDAWRAFGVPCAPSGITRALAADRYPRMTLAERAALVWKVHRVKMRLLLGNLQMHGRVWVASYEQMVEDIGRTVQELQVVLGAKKSTGKYSQPNPAANEKWRTELSPDEVAAVRAVRDDPALGEQLEALCYWHQSQLIDSLPSKAWMEGVGR